MEPPGRPSLASNTPTSSTSSASSAPSTSSIRSSLSKLSFYDNDSTNAETPITPPLSDSEYFQSSHKIENKPQKDQALDEAIEDMSGLLGNLALDNSSTLVQELTNSRSLKNSMIHKWRESKGKGTRSSPIDVQDSDEDGSMPFLPLPLRSSLQKSAEAPGAQYPNARSTNSQGNLRRGSSTPFKGSSNTGINFPGPVFHKSILPTKSKIQTNQTRSSIKTTVEPSARVGNASTAKSSGAPAVEDVMPENPPPTHRTSISSNKTPKQQQPRAKKRANTSASKTKAPRSSSQASPPNFQPFHKATIWESDIKNRMLNILHHQNRPRQDNGAESLSPSNTNKAGGYIYIFTSELRRNHHKIGKTKKDPAKRTKQWANQCNFTPIRIRDSNDRIFQDFSMVEKLVQWELARERRKFRCGKCMVSHKFDHRAGEGSLSEKTEHGEWYEISQERALKVVEKWRSWADNQPYAADGRLTKIWKWKYDQARRGIEMDWYKRALVAIKWWPPKWVRAIWWRDNQEVAMDWDRWVQVTWEDHIRFSFHCLSAEMKILVPKVTALFQHASIIIAVVVPFCACVIWGAKLGITISSMVLMVMFLLWYKFG